MSKPQLDTISPTSTDREVITNLKRLAENIGALSAQVDSLQARVNNMPPSLTVEQIKTALMAEGLLLDPVRPS